jgi:hypothetical protein
MLDDISSSRRTVTAGCLRQISCAIQFLFDFEFLFLRSLLHSGACAGCFRGVYQNPPEGTGVTFAEIADVFATCLVVPYTAVFGTLFRGGLSYAFAQFEEVNRCGRADADIELARNRPNALASRASDPHRLNSGSIIGDIRWPAELHAVLSGPQVRRRLSEKRLRGRLFGCRAVRLKRPGDARPPRLAVFPAPRPRSSRVR